MHCLETIIKRNKKAGGQANKRIIREALLLVVNSPIASDYLRMRVAEALRHLKGLR